MSDGNDGSTIPQVSTGWNRRILKWPILLLFGVVAADSIRQAIL